ncbi:TIGR03089 family protein [Corynebacterium uterequi]|nr:TIGR03089 family protein [Corynebacterium uterequi]
MQLLAHLLAADPATPRLTVYNDAASVRMDFSAQTLDNWASKIANLLLEELELFPDGDAMVVIDLPPSWQAAVIALGALTARVPYTVNASRDTPVAAVFTTVEGCARWANAGVDVLALTDDPFGRGVEETGLALPPGVIDFGPIVRFYGDYYYGDAPALPDVVAPDGAARRLLSLGWRDDADFAERVLRPLAAGGSCVVVVPPASTQRIDAIAAAEKATERLL